MGALHLPIQISVLVPSLNGSVSSLSDIDYGGIGFPGSHDGAWIQLGSSFSYHRFFPDDRNFSAFDDSLVGFSDEVCYSLIYSLTVGCKDTLYARVVFKAFLVDFVATRTQ